MTRYLIQRAGQALLVLWAAFTLSFILLQVLPGDAILIKFQNPDLGLSPAQIEEMRDAYGASNPIWQQYLHALTAMLHGDVGYSVQAGVPVSELIASNFPATLRLAVPGFLLATVIAAVVAFSANLTAFRWLKNILHSVPALFISLPDLLAGYCADSDLLVSAALDPGDQSR